MSYNHPILVPGAVGHDDPEALRSVIETLSVNSEEEIASFHDDLSSVLRTLDGVSGKLEAITKWIRELPEDVGDDDILDMASDAFYEVSQAISEIDTIG